MQAPAWKPQSPEAQGAETQEESQVHADAKGRSELLGAAQAKEPRDPENTGTTASGDRVESSQGALAIVLGSVSEFRSDPC